MHWSIKIAERYRWTIYEYKQGKGIGWLLLCIASKAKPVRLINNAGRLWVGWIVETKTSLVNAWSYSRKEPFFK